MIVDALEHGGERVAIELNHVGELARLVISDDGDGIGNARHGTGLSIVEALVRNELRGELLLHDMPGLRATVEFPL